MRYELTREFLAENQKRLDAQKSWANAQIRARTATKKTLIAKLKVVLPNLTAAEIEMLIG